MIATLQGYVSVMIHNEIRVDITIDRAIRLVNNRVTFVGPIYFVYFIIYLIKNMEFLLLFFFCF